MFPTNASLVEAINGFMERLQDVRAADKKHIQVRAYYDLLKYMKVQGLRTSASTALDRDIQQKIIDNKMDTEGLGKYFYKAYETYSMLRSASQVDDQSDLKNMDVMRVQGFSKSLIDTILKMNADLVDTRAALVKF